VTVSINKKRRIVFNQALVTSFASQCLHCGNQGTCTSAAYISLLRSIYLVARSYLAGVEVHV